MKKTTKNLFLREWWKLKKMAVNVIPRKLFVGLGIVEEDPEEIVSEGVWATGKLYAMLDCWFSIKI